MRVMKAAVLNTLERLRRDQSGYAMAAVMGAMVMVTGLVGVTLKATNGDLGLTKRDLDDKRAYSAAQAGVADYSFHLNNDNNYWAKCTTVPNPNAVNQMGSTTKKRTVPGTTDAQYAIELIPKQGQSTCSTTNPVGTMLESTGINTGSFRIRSTGFVGKTKSSIVATFKRASLLDYVYFTQLETSDPVTYGYPNPSAALTGAYSQCSKFLRENRQSSPIPGTGGEDYCTQIVFVTGDLVEGPLHTNDALQICGTPTFGRSPADLIEVSSPPTGWVSRCGGGDDPNFVGQFKTTAPVLTPPPTNGKLKTIAGTTYTRSCQTRIVLSGNNMTVTNMTTGSSSTFAIPPDGVFYVANGNSSCSSSPCTTSYSPFTASIPASSQCGNVLVSGSYSGQLTIAAENDIIVEENITRTGSGLLGLVANNFVRVKHPYPTQTSRDNCGNGSGSSSLGDVRIDAAILAIQHSFIVDHYDCGSPLGELEVNGAISQKWRGPVGSQGGGGSIVHGYRKDYNYDDRLRYQEPPFFLDPIESAWHIQRETIDFP